MFPRRGRAEQTLFSLRECDTGSSLCRDLVAIFEVPGSLTQPLLGERDHLGKGLPAQAAAWLRLPSVIKEFFQGPKWDHSAKVLLAPELFPLSQSVKSVTVMKTSSQ